MVHITDANGRELMFCEIPVWESRQHYAKRDKQFRDKVQPYIEKNELNGQALLLMAFALGALERESA